MVVAVVAVEHRTRPVVADCSNLVVTFFYSLFGCLTFVVAYLGIQCRRSLSLLIQGTRPE